MSKSVLTCVGYSEISQEVAKVADAWAKKMHAELHLLHVRDPSPYVPETPESFNTFVQGMDLSCTPQVHTPTGNPKQVIIDTARQLEADMVVIAAHEHTLAGTIIVGSVSNHVAHHAPCPVLTVRRQEEDLNGIIVPVDYTDINTEVIAEADRLARDTSEPLYFIHVAPQIDAFMSWGIDAGALDTQSSDTMEHHETVEKMKLDNYIADQKVRASHENITCFGRPHEEILKLQATVGANLIMMAAHSSNIIERLLLGGNTRHILNAAHCSVLVYRKKADKLSPVMEKIHPLSDIVV